jgi:uncharacterized protein YggE
MKGVLATLCTLLCTGLASANITVSGHGKVVYVPDVGYVSVGVSSDGKTAAEAWEKNAEVVRKVFEALKKNGIDPKDMKTAGLNVTPRYVHPKDQEPQLVGYTVTYDLSVTVRKLGDLGKVLDELVASGANRRMNIGFGCSDLERLLDQARVKAAADARKKAELYTGAAGASLGQVVAISDTHAAPIRSFAIELDQKPAAGGLPIAAGEQELSVDVTITYALNQGPLPPRS